MNKKSVTVMEGFHAVLDQDGTTVHVRYNSVIVPEKIDPETGRPIGILYDERISIPEAISFKVTELRPGDGKFTYRIRKDNVRFKGGAEGAVRFINDEFNTAVAEHLVGWILYAREHNESDEEQKGSL